MKSLEPTCFSFLFPPFPSPSSRWKTLSVGKQDPKAPMSRATTDPVAGVSEQLRRCEPTYPCTNNDHVCWVSCRLQPIFNNVQQLFVVFVVETILREAREPLGAQETCQQEDWEEDWGEKRREEKRRLLAMSMQVHSSQPGAWRHRLPPSTLASKPQRGTVSV